MFQTAIALLGVPLLAASPAPNVVLDGGAVPAVAAAGPTLAAAVTLPSGGAVEDTTHRRPRAVEYSDAYYTRLTVHRWGSYVELPLFAGEWVLGQRLLTQGNNPTWLKPTHQAVAGALGVLFTVNTVTGVWNLWDARHDENDRAKRITHSVLMLAADGGFAVAGALGKPAHNSINRANQHRDVAIASIGVASVGTAMMWLLRD